MKKTKIKTVRVRIAPSPTGQFHIGTARTALFNYLFAKKNKGTFILRIEDTDKKRSSSEFEKDIIESLKWLGLEWDEFYKQSERTKIYEKYIKRLLDGGLAYYCFHSIEELEKEKEAMLARGEAPKYPGHCRNLSRSEIQDKLKRGVDYVIRFKIPERKITFRDLIRGQITFDASLFGDIAIAKDISLPFYNLAAVIDDQEMKISHVIRGEDHLPNTPKQILLQEALDFDSPQYAHLPLILGPDRSKLSKRHGATAVNEYRQLGYLPEALINFMALLGWNPGTDKEIFSLEQLVKEFLLERIGKSGAIFNIEKLNWLNGHYIRKLSSEKLAEIVKQYFDSDQLKLYKENDFIKIIKLFQDRLKTLNEVKELADFFFQEKLRYDQKLLIWKNDAKEKTLLILKEIKNDLRTKDLKLVLKNLSQKFTIGGVFWPFRVALTGKKASPDPLEIAEILGKEKTLQRINEAIEKLQ